MDTFCRDASILISVDSSITVSHNVLVLVWGSTETQVLEVGIVASLHVCITMSLSIRNQRFIDLLEYLIRTVQADKFGEFYLLFYFLAMNNEGNHNNR